MSTCRNALIVVAFAAHSMAGQAGPGEIHSPSIGGTAYYRLRQQAADARAANRTQEADSLYRILTASYAFDPELWESAAATAEAIGDRTRALQLWETAWRTGAWPRAEVAYVI